MTIGKAIEIVDRLKPNKFQRIDKIRWLSELDALIWHDLISTHEQPVKRPCTTECEGWVPDPCDQTEPVRHVGFDGYPEDAPDDTELMVKFPHDTLYLRYLESQIDLNNMEITKYNNSRSLFNNAYLTYTDWYNRTHMPVQAGGFRFTEARRAGDMDALAT